MFTYEDGMVFINNPSKFGVIRDGNACFERDPIWDLDTDKSTVRHGVDTILFPNNKCTEFHLNAMHHCIDDSVGFADFVGLRKDLDGIEIHTAEKEDE
jgi:hypothetical protein